MLLSRKAKVILTATSVFFLIFADFDDGMSGRSRLLKAPLVTNPVVLRDGTLLVGRRSEVRACDYFTKRRAHPRKVPPRDITGIHYHFDDCSEHQLGNRLGEYYQRYLLASSARLPYRMTCGDVNSSSTKQIINLNRVEQEDESVLKHLEGHYGVPEKQHWTVEEVCRHTGGAGWDSKDGPERMMDIFRKDMAYLAYNTTTGESIQNETEDAVIHLRLGDALKGANDQRIGLLPHKAYANILQETMKQKNLSTIETIGIVTQPFERGLARGFDRMQVTLDKSRAIAIDLQRYLAKIWPKAKIRIHNDEHEIPLKSFARLIRAKQVAVCGSSTFCTYPVLSVGENALGYVYRTERHSPWAPKLEGVLPNIRTFVAPRLANNFTAKLDIDTLIYWLRNQDLEVADLVIDQDPLIRNNETASAHDVKRRLMRIEAEEASE